MTKRMLIMIGVVLVVFTLIGLIFYLRVQKMMKLHAAMVPPPAAVTTVVVEPRTWQPVLRRTGWLKANNGVQVSTDLAGIVSEIAFESGKPVKKGALLIKLDTTQEQAQLQNAEARLELARLNLERKKDLLEKKATSQADYDAAAAEARQAEAAVKEVQAVISRKTIHAPFDGILGIRLVSLGQYLNAGAAIVPLEAIDPIYVEFAVPQQDYNKVTIGRALHVWEESLEKQVFEGQITAINSQFSDTNMNIMVQATVRNPDGLLRAGMYVRLDVLQPEMGGVLAIPAAAISYSPYGDSVFVVKTKTDEAGKTVRYVVQQFVKTGVARGDLVSITKGLQEGDEVVSSGAFKLRPNAEVQVNNEVRPAEEENPSPPDT